jgi:hypothetical protein
MPPELHRIHWGERHSNASNVLPPMLIHMANVPVASYRPFAWRLSDRRQARNYFGIRTRSGLCGFRRPFKH